jgi:calcium/calmodulin-dependent protein kinase (CaM kinase) II
MSDKNVDEVLSVNRKLLESIVAADWKTYAELCDPNLSCFEPEARGQVVEGMAFHKFYFDLGAGSGARTTTMASPHVRFLGPDVAVLAYMRLTQKLAADGAPVTTAVEETRIWHRQAGVWKHVHFHRSLPG